MWTFKGKQRPTFALVPGEDQESVWDYPRPPVCVPDQRIVQVQLGRKLIARTKSAIRVLETASPPTFYIPRSDIDMELLTEKQVGSSCEWKGGATYWDLKQPTHLRNIGWSYETPNQEFVAIAKHLSFYPAIVDCYVDQEFVKPQPGGFYGGWVTREILGPYKGEPGTYGW